MSAQATPASATTSPLIATEAVSFIGHGRRIIDRVSLAVAAQDFITIIGPNGAGKTTLLKLMLGLLPPSEGRVLRAAGLKLGYMPQGFRPSPNLPLTVARLLAMHTRPGADGNWQHKVMDMTRLAPLLPQALHNLSGGEMQRVLLTAALLDRPHILVLDEPTQNLDVQAQHRFYRLLETLHKEAGISILMVSHDLHRVMASTRRVVCLYGHICCSGAPQAIARDPEFARLFGANMAVYFHDHDHSHDALPEAKP